MNKILSFIICCSVFSVSATAESSCKKSSSEVFREVSPSVVQIFSVSIDPSSLPTSCRDIRGIEAREIGSKLGRIRRFLALEANFYRTSP